MRQLILKVIVGFTALHVWAASAANAASPEQNAFESIVSKAAVKQLATAGAEFRKSGRKEKVELNLTTHVGKLAVNLKPFDIRGKGYKAEITTEKGRIPDPFVVDLFEANGGGSELEFARVALITNPKTGEKKVQGFLRSGGEYYQVTQAKPNADQVLSTKLSRAELSRLLQRCGVDHAHGSFDVSHLTAAVSRRARGVPPVSSITGYKELQLATDADREYVLALGSETSANAEILSLLASVDAIYREQLGVHIIVTYQHAWNTGDPYSTDVLDALDDFGDYWELNFRDSHTYDLAHLFSGRSYGGTLGVAWVGAVCGDPYYEYGLTATLHGYLEYSVVVIAHELGHNMGANHDLSGTCEDVYIMCPTAGSTSQFSPASINAITSHIQSTSCLSDTTGPDPEPREDPISLNVSINGNRVRYVIENSTECSTVELVAARTRAALDARSDVVSIGTLAGSASKISARSSRVRRFKKGKAAGKLFFDLNCDGTPMNVVKTIRASKIVNDRKTKNLNNVLLDLSKRFSQ